MKKPGLMIGLGAAVMFVGEILAVIGYALEGKPFGAATSAVTASASLVFAFLFLVDE